MQYFSQRLWEGLNEIMAVSGINTVKGSHAQGFKNQALESIRTGVRPCFHLLL